MYCTRVIIYNKTRELVYVSVDRKTFLCFEMTSTSLLKRENLISETRDSILDLEEFTNKVINQTNCEWS